MKRALALAGVALTTSWLNIGLAAEPAAKAEKSAAKSASKADGKAAEKAAPAAKAEEAKPAGTPKVVAAADPSKAKPIVDKVCAACHGVDGNGPVSTYPKLAGQFPAYLEKQLKNFKPGASGKAERPSPVMTEQVKSLTDDDIRNLAAYYASQTPKPGTAKNKDTVPLGQKLWRGGDVARGIPACAGCHGPAGAGVPVQYPRVAGQNAEYTEAALKEFRAGTRTNDANKAMRTVAAKLNDAEVKAVADYAAGLK